MVKLSKAIYEVIERDFGRDEFLRRISDPFWFQSFACVLGYDWHSSGTTTVTCGALKVALNPEENGIAVLGGKGKASRKTPEEIENVSSIFSFSTDKMEKLIYSSKISAKVDNNLVQDGYQLYQHSFFLTENGKWAVIQQGMNNFNSYARRYHWLSDDVKDFVVEPQKAICCDKKGRTLNMTAKESEKSRKVSVDITKEKPKYLEGYLNKKRKKVFEYKLEMPKKHEINLMLYKRLNDLYEFKPKNYEEIVAFKGVGPKTIRALSLLGELIYGEKPSFKDPAKFSFAFGGKDSIPYPINKQKMDEATNIFETAINEAKLGKREKINSIKRLKNFVK